MKGKIKYSILVSLFLIFGLLSLILFLTIPDQRLDSPVFWISFSFAIPVNYLALTGFTLWGFAKKGESFVKLPIATVVAVAFAGIYLLVGALFMYLPAEKTTFPIILYAIITIAFIITAIFSINGANYMNASEKNVKQKVLFIKMLEADILDCAAKANGNTAASLRQLAENVRFSDPMSHASLSGVESELSSVVFTISDTLSQDSDADVSALINKADSLLKSRNNRCMMLK